MNTRKGKIRKTKRLYTEMCSLAGMLTTCDFIKSFAIKPRRRSILEQVWIRATEKNRQVNALMEAL